MGTDLEALPAFVDPEYAAGFMEAAGEGSEEEEEEEEEEEPVEVSAVLDALAHEGDRASAAPIFW